MTSAIAESLKKCDPTGPTIVHITKLYNTTDALSFRAFGRVLSGTLKKGMPVKVLGEGYSPEDEEDMARAVAEELWIGESRFEVTTSAKQRVLSHSAPPDMLFQLRKHPLEISS
jgi:U5 small nuclear ribonucleoprotein component